MGFWDSILDFLGFNFNWYHNNSIAGTQNQSSDDHICSVPAAKRFKPNPYPGCENSILEREKMSPKLYFSSKRKVATPHKPPPVIQINETDDDDDDIQVIHTASVSHLYNEGSSNRNNTTKTTSSSNDEDEIQVLSSDSDDIQVVPSSPCSSRSKVTNNNKENQDDDDDNNERQPLARKMQMNSILPSWNTIPKTREASFIFKRKNPHERHQSTLKQIQKLQSREEYGRLIQAITSCNNGSTITPSSTRTSPTPAGSEMDSLDRLSQDHPRHISINVENQRSYVDVASSGTSTSKFRFLKPAPQSLHSRIPVAGRRSTGSQNTEDKMDAMIQRIQSIDLRRFDANIGHRAMVLQAQDLKVKSLEVPSYNVLLEKTINLRKVPEKLQPKKQEPKLPEITKEMEYLIKSMKASARPDSVVSKIGLEEITKDQISSLEGLTWLKDNVINCYMALLMARSKENDGKLPKAYGFNTFFHTALSEHGYSRVKRWTKKVDLFSHDIIFVPIHVQKIHWCLATIDFRKKCVSYYDSMAGGDRGVNQRLLKYLAEESMDKRKIPFDTASWSVQCPKDIPQQQNSCDCGVFTSTFAEYLARNADIYQVKQANMPYYRKKMMVEILNKKLMT